MLSCAVPKMIGETAPVRMSGQFGIVTNLAIVFGIMVAIMVGAGLADDNLKYSSYYWRIVFLCPAALAAIQSIALIFFFKEDSINFLIAEGGTESAMKLISKVYKKEQDTK